VPDRLREFQWAHAPDGRAPAAFVERVQALLVEPPSRASTGPVSPSARRVGQAPLVPAGIGQPLTIPEIRHAEMCSGLQSLCVQRRLARSVGVSPTGVRVGAPLIVDGWGYGKQGVAGSFAADASLGVIASVLLGALLIWFTLRRPAAPMADTGTS
jgi:hypothetical protein